MKRTLLKVSLVGLLSAAGWLAMIPQVAHAQVVGIAAGVWGWRNIVAPRIGGPFVAPEVRFRPFAGFVVDGADTQAQVMVRVPDPSAEVWIQGQPMREMGRQRVFSSPPLDPRLEYAYEIRARWRENGQTNDQTRTVPIRPGQQIVIDFARPLSE